MEKAAGSYNGVGVGSVAHFVRFTTKDGETTVIISEDVQIFGPKSKFYPHIVLQSNKELVCLSKTWSEDQK